MKVAKEYDLKMAAKNEAWQEAFQRTERDLRDLRLARNVGREIRNPSY